MALEEDYLAKVKKPKYITDELLQAIDMIAQARDSELAFDKTIIAEVISLEDGNTGEYLVEYQHGKFNAYAPINLGYVYPEGSNVYVKIPGGDFSNKKLIEGKASSTTMKEEVYDYISNQLTEMSDAYPLNENEYSILISNSNQNNPYREKIIYNNTTEISNDKFISLFTAYPRIKISADFKTDFKGEAKSGNYGLIVEFYIKDESGNQSSKTLTRRLERRNFSGTLNEYTSYAPQNAIYDMNTSTNILTGIKKITFFQEYFDSYDTIYDANGNKIYENTDTPNIFVRNIKISFCDIIDDSGSMYYVGISAPDGLSMIYNTDSINLKGVFYYLGKDIMNSKHCQCYWYKQNPEVVVGHSLYDYYGGAGWENITDSPNVNFNYLKIYGSDVYQQLRIKLVVVYNEKSTHYKEIKIVKYYNDRFAIVKNTVEDEVFLELLDGHNPSNKTTVADWYAKTDDGSYQPLDTKTNKINITQYLQYSEVFFQANIDIGENKKVPYDFTLKNILADAEVRVVYEGPDTFLYDENGDITYSESEKEIIIIPHISTKSDTQITSVTWFAPSGAQLYESKINPANSMLKNLYVDKENKLHFQIYQKYNTSKLSNTLELKIETVNGETYHFNKTINFVKQGEQGVSGLTYTLVMKQCDANGNEIELTPMLFKGNNCDAIYLRPVVYEDGAIIKNGETHNGKKYSISYTIQGINVSIAEKGSGSYYQIIGKSSPETNGEHGYSKQGQYFIRIIAKIKVDNTETLINYFYPILVAYGSNINVKNFSKIQVPTSIIYDAAGGNPKYSSQPIEVIYNGVSQTQYKKPIAMNNNVTIVETGTTLTDNPTEYRIYPVQTFKGSYFPLPGETDRNATMMTAIKIPLKDSRGFGINSYLVQPITMILSSQMNQGISGYDGTIITTFGKDNTEFNDVKSSVGVGHMIAEESKDYPDIFSDGFMLGENLTNNKIGFWGYDDRGYMSQSLESDGSFSLGNGFINFSKTENGYTFSIEKLFNLTFDRNGVNIEFSDDFREALGLSKDGGS